MIKLNLLPKNLRRRVEPGWWRLAAAAVVLAALGVVAFLHISTLSRVQALENQRDQLQVEVDVLRPFIAEQNRLNQQQRELEQLLAVRNQLRERFVPWSDNLAQVINQIPREGRRFGVALRSIGTKSLTPQEIQSNVQNGLYDGKPVSIEFNLQGEAIGQNALIRFVEAFENSPRFGINFQNASLDQTRQLYTFGATIGLVGQAAATASNTTGGEDSGSPSR
ncbi:MAG: flagellar protein FliT [Meiothermus ruber]|uniref:Flagellar protein FliT n=1 Tax=Meiothermus ruber TaxID=277 RepID=A0A7C3DGE2_MEIRU|nr:flagellar protein FliT [Meiothermus ruber]